MKTHGRIKVFWSLAPCPSCGVYSPIQACMWKLCGTSHLAAIYFSAGRRDQPGMCAAQAGPSHYQPSQSPLCFSLCSCLLAWVRSGPTLWPSASLTMPSLGKVWAAGDRGWLEAEMEKLLDNVTREWPVLAAASSMDLGTDAHGFVSGDALARAEKKNGLWALLLLV